MTMKKAADRFWDYALTIYGADDAREAFLRLQDRDGADIPMLLWCIWCGSDGVGLTPEVMREAVQFSSNWQRFVVASLRGLRREMKAGVDSAPADLTEEARARVAMTEQTVERLQMIHLAELSSGLPHIGASARANIYLYAELATLSLESADLDTVLARAESLASA